MSAFSASFLLSLCGDSYVANHQHGKMQIHWQRHSSFAFKSIASPCEQRVIGKKGFETIFSYAKFSNVFFAALFPRTIYNSENVFHFLCVEQNNVCRKDGQNFYNKQVDASGKKRSLATRSNSTKNAMIDTFPDFRWFQTERLLALISSFFVSRKKENNSYYLEGKVTNALTLHWQISDAFAVRVLRRGYRW